MTKTSGQKDPSMDEILGSIRRIISEDNAQSGQSTVPAKDAPVAADDDILDLTDALESPAEPETRREPVLKAVETANGNDASDAQGERREPVLGIHTPAPETMPAPEATPAAEPLPDEPVTASAATPPVAETEVAPDIAAAAGTPGQEEEVVMAASDEPPAPPAEQPEPASEGIVSQPTSSATTAALGELSKAVEERAGRLRLGEGDATVSEIVKELLRPMLRDWIDQNLPAIVERVVRREIQKLVDRAPGDD